MPFCAVATCANSVKSSQEINISFFTFPKCPKKSAEWKRKCARADPVNLRTARICSKHFKEEDFDTSCLQKRSFGIKCKMFLKNGASPSINLPSSSKARGEEVQQKRQQRQEQQQQKEQQQEEQGQDGGRTDRATKGPYDVEERRKTSKQERRERQEKKERKELVEQILAEHERQQQAALLNPTPEPGTAKRLKAKADIRKHRSKRPYTVPAWAEASVARAVARARLAKRLSGAAPAATTPDPATTPSEYDQPAFDDDAGAAPGDSGSDGDRGDRGSDGAPGSDLKTTSTAHLFDHPRSKRCDVMERTKQIMLQKQRLRRLEAKCLLALGGLSQPHPGEDSGKADPSTTDEKAANENEPQGNGEDGSSNPAGRARGEDPLVILRSERGARLPSIMRQLREYQLSDSMVSSMPSNLQEAQEAHHRLKMMFLNLQAAMLKWAMKNKQLRDGTAKTPTEGDEETVNTIRSSRLRELLRLEAAVKGMFTEAQIRYIVRNHADSSSDTTAGKQRKHHWGEEDLRRMLELRAISSDKVVKHVREQMKIPLPNLKTVQLRCKRSTELSEAYKEMLRKCEENRKRCDMCEGQLKTIDGVIDAASDTQPKACEESPFGRQFAQRIPQHEADPTSAKPRKRRRRAAEPAASPAQKKQKSKRRGVAYPALDAPDSSDSEETVSDLDIWDGPPRPPLGWRLGVAGGSARPDTSPPDLYGYTQTQKCWR